MRSPCSVCVCLYPTETNCHETWHVFHAAGGHLDGIYHKFLPSAIPVIQTSAMLVLILLECQNESYEACHYNSIFHTVLSTLQPLLLYCFIDFNTHNYWNFPLLGISNTKIILRRKKATDSSQNFLFLIEFIPLLPYNLYCQQYCIWSSCWPRRLFTSRPGFEIGCVGFIVDKVSLGRVFSEYFGFSCQFILSYMLHFH
jgi:hypothetical protein